MAVYVDPLTNWGGSATFRWRESCHMYADTLGQLHALARRIGLRRAWFQDSNGFYHYDLTGYKRGAAIRAGAVEHTRDEMVEFVRAGRGREAP